MNFLQKEIKNEIMATDIFICVTDEKASQKEIQDSIDKAFDILRDIEKRFSRFLANNELSSFNKASGNIKISDDLMEMLEKSLHFNKFTNGAFDISILPNLISEGYNVSKKSGYYKSNSKNDSPTLPSFSKITDLVLDKQNKTAFKPRDLKIDLGGIAKGFAVDKVSKFLRQKYQNFLVDAGGDIFASGSDLKNNYPYWAVEIENPLEPDKSTDILMLSNKSVATSGINRRKWIKDGQQKNHIIDPNTGKSVSNNLLAVTVVANTATEADVLAKGLLIMGLKKGLILCEISSISAYFTDNDLRISRSSKINEYVWKE